ncbi:PspC domain-containing protein [Actinomyces bowdenii]|uniref:PspC domain-containing protein n=1 Tax=Actinomyces bowdenii TaxID=131109 RepID=A0A853ER76_9ACTO|nr:PspC domain-containing protein [Actinomyces bowdenii]MBF0698003.1 PspC domain-containing protein [Actinomyces bowdenii]MCR2052728.1 PspC domain-containing protein [Actinomyces bowdenii]MDO5064324.1 PspC domain-containing protein [Actinomyces bowdenii]NYS70176.1 PspC domain-containing protein [Actinomyces bowdenii]
MAQQYPSGPDRTTRNESSFTSFLNGLPARSRHDRILGGVCGGLARQWGRSPGLVRLATIALALLPGPMWVAYALAWAAMPLEPLHSGPAYGAPAHGGPVGGEADAAGPGPQ